MSQTGDITLLLQRADQGDRDAAGRLFRLVESDLKLIARKRRRTAPASADASTTLLVDEAFCRLVGNKAATWQPGDRRKFVGFAARKMHDLLVKAARAERASKRGGGRQRLEREEGEIAAPVGGAFGNPDMLLDLKEALDRFEQFAPEDALGFRLRFFLNCTFEELAEVLGVSATEAKRTFQRAKLWLSNELKEYALDA
jgi:RNA polymerase sigma factor (TIGR02999 family)